MDRPGWPRRGAGGSRQSRSGVETLRIAPRGSRGADGLDEERRREPLVWCPRARQSMHGVARHGLAGIGRAVEEAHRNARTETLGMAVIACGARQSRWGMAPQGAPRMSSRGSAPQCGYVLATVRMGPARQQRIAVASLGTFGPGSQGPASDGMHRCGPDWKRSRGHASHGKRGNGPASTGSRGPS